MTTKIRIDEASDGPPFEWGHYIERNDGPVDDKTGEPTGPEDWTPLIYTGEGDEDLVRAWHEQDINPQFPTRRNSRVVRRTVGPWEVTS